MINLDAPIALADSTPAEWLEDLYTKASIGMYVECRENLKLTAEHLKEGYLWFLESHDSIALDFMELLGVVNKALWGVLDEQFEANFFTYKIQ